MDILVGIAIVLAAIAIWFLIMYFGIKQIYNLLKPKINSITERTEKIDELERRLELLEKKCDNK